MQIRKQKVIFVPLLISIVFASLLFVSSSGATEKTAISLTPSIISGGTVGLSGNFTVTAHISDVSNLWGWSFGLSWDPTVLKLVDSVSEGSFLKDSGQTLFSMSPINNEQGLIQNINTVFVSKMSVSGSGALVSFTFQVIDYGSTEISLNSVELYAMSSGISAGNLIPVTVADAHFDSVPAAIMPASVTSSSGVVCVVLSGSTDVSSVSLGPDPDPVGSTVKVDLYMRDAVGVWGWCAYVSWNAAVLELTGVQNKHWIGDSTGDGDLFTGSQSALWDNVHGLVRGGISDVNSDSLTNVASGSGVLATLTFRVVGVGVSEVSLASNTTLSLNSADQTGVHASVHNASIFIGQSSNPSPSPSSTPISNSTSPHGPTAQFSPLNNTSYNLGDSVFLNASKSTSGYDTLNASEICPITAYTWRVEYLNGTVFGTYTGEIVSFSADAEGFFRIILIVTASDPTPPSDSEFVPTDTASVIIRVGSSPLVSNVDVFTDRGGVGVSVSSGAYGGNEIMRIYALVTYADVPVANQDVAFTVNDSSGLVVAVRTARTNQTGFAYTEYRLLNPNGVLSASSAQIWSITASVNVSQTTVSDIAPFAFGYLGSIQNLQVPQSVHRLESLSIQLTISNFVNSTAWSELDITLFDTANVPIGSCTVIHSPEMQNFTVVAAHIFVPSWAFTGQATAYVCLLAQSADGKSVPIAPEVAKTFQILPHS